VAGMNGTSMTGYSGDGGPATKAQLNFPNSVAVDAAGNLYINDWFNDVIRKVTYSTGIITTVAGNHTNYCDLETFGGDGVLATSASLCFSPGVSVDDAGNLYLWDEFSRIQIVKPYKVLPTKETAAPILSLSEGTYDSPQTLRIKDATPGAAIRITMDGSTPNGASPGYYGPIDISGTVTVQAIAVAPDYLPSPTVSAAYTITSRPQTEIETIAGNGMQGFSGAGRAATDAELGYPNGIALDSAGDRYIADSVNNVIWKVSAKTETITIVAGNKKAGYHGNNGPAVDAELNSPREPQSAARATSTLRIAKTMWFAGWM